MRRSIFIRSGLFAAVLCFVGPAFANPVITPERLKTLDANVLSYVDEAKVSNMSYGMWQSGQLTASGFRGPVHEATVQPVSGTVIHRIYSMTKPVTAIGLLILLEEGYFALDDPITKFLPEFEDTLVLADYDSDGEMFTYRPVRPPTMGQLLSHTAGFVYGNQGFGFLEDKLSELQPLASATGDDLVEKVASLPYNALPGSEFRYSISSDLQGVIIERITGETLDTFLTRELFEPLGMTDTGFFVEETELNRVSSVTRITDDVLIYTKEPSAGYEAQAANFFEGGQGLFSTMRDYQIFATFLMNGGRLGDLRLLGEERVELFHDNAIRYRGLPARQGANGDPAGLGYGYGVATIEDRRLANLNAPDGTYFWYGALGTWFWVDPENEIIFVGMMQSHSVPAHEMLKLSMNTLYEPPEPESQSTQEGSSD